MTALTGWRRLLIPALLAGGALFLYGRSLSYEFVYDDHWRVEANPAIEKLSNAPRFFWDRTAQSGNPALHRDSYRPLVTLSFAIDHALWGNRPAGYRLENILLHALNATLIFMLGDLILGLTTAASLFGALIFLCHPVQTESVAWVVERTNVLGLAFLLSGLLSWARFLGSGRKHWAAATYVFLAASLLTREIAVVFPALAFLIDFGNDGRRRRHYVYMSLEVLAYLFLRRTLLGQMQIAPFWGGSFFTNIVNVLNTWAVYLRLLIWPRPLRVTYSDLPVAGLDVPAHFSVGAALFVVFLATAVFAWRRTPRVSFCLFGFLFLWLPGSNIVPLTALFAERLLYPLVVCAAWLAGIAFDAAVERFGSDHVRLARGTLASLIILSMSAATVRQLPVWESDAALWGHAARVAPGSWFAWACLGDVRQRKGRLEDAESAYISALKLHVPVESAARLFQALAGIKRAQGQKSSANEFSRRAAVLLGQADVVSFPSNP